MTKTTKAIETVYVNLEEVKNVPVFVPSMTLLELIALSTT